MGGRATLPTRFFLFVYTSSSTDESRDIGTTYPAINSDKALPWRFALDAEVFPVAIVFPHPNIYDWINIMIFKRAVQNHKIRTNKNLFGRVHNYFWHPHYLSCLYQKKEELLRHNKDRSICFKLTRARIVLTSWYIVLLHSSSWWYLEFWWLSSLFLATKQEVL